MSRTRHARKPRPERLEDVVRRINHLETHLSKLKARGARQLSLKKLEQDIKHLKDRRDFLQRSASSNGSAER